MSTLDKAWAVLVEADPGRDDRIRTDARNAALEEAAQLMLTIFIGTPDEADLSIESARAIRALKRDKK